MLSVFHQNVFHSDAIIKKSLLSVRV